MTATRTALITGANRGIGLEIARALAQRGDVRVLAAARTQDSADEAADAAGRGSTGVALDLSEPGAVQARADEIAETHGPVDIFVNNAGVLINGHVLDMAPGDLNTSFAVNAAAPHALIRSLAPGMKARAWGRVVNVSSGWGSFDEGLSGPAAYSISKAALNALTVTAAQALGSSVKVNAACPGWVRTRMGGQVASRSPQEGADTPVWLATLPGDGPTGGFFRDRRLIEW